MANPAEGLRLNARQREAIHYLDGPLLVLAGAGSGKTRVITQKIGWLIEECGIRPSRIAAITFTNKAAREMQDRIAKMLPQGSSKGLTVSTFHSLGVRFLREEHSALGYKKTFSIFDANDCYAVIGELAGTVDKSTIRYIQSLISGWKNALQTPDQVEVMTKKSDAEDHEKLAAVVYRNYEATLKAYQAVDFDDLIRLPVEVLRSHPEIRDRWENRFTHLLIDEYQDTNGAQYQWLKMLAGVRASFTAVGDDDQAIYAWRGADIENLKRLTVDYPRLNVVKLEQNYRSTARILTAANVLIRNNPKLFEKTLWSEHGPGEAISVHACTDNETEAESVVIRLLAHKAQHRCHFSDYAVLYRSNHQARVFEQALRQYRVPYLISGGQSFFDKAEIKDIVAYLRLLLNQDDDPAFIRAATTPRRGIGSQTLETLGNYAGERHISLFQAATEEGLRMRLNARQQEPLTAFINFILKMEWRAEREPVAQVFPDLLKAIDYENYLYDTDEAKVAQTKWANVVELEEWLIRKGEGDNDTPGRNLIEMAQSIALITLLDKRNEEKIDAVQLSTLHASKGLEFPHVFLVGAEEGILPHRESMEESKLEEERRLMYVGITRAQRSLSLSYAKKRKQAREWIPCEPSRFIAEMGDDLRFFGTDTDEVADRSTGNHHLAAMRAMLGG